MKFTDLIQENDICKTRIDRAKQLLKLFSKGKFRDQDNLSGKADFWEYEYHENMQSKPTIMCVGDANKVEIHLVVNLNKPLPFTVKLNNDVLGTSNHLDSTKEHLLKRLCHEFNNKFKHFGVEFYIETTKY